MPGLTKSLWASIQGDPVFMRRLNGWLTMFWVAMIPVSFELGWLKSVTYVSALSLWALVPYGHSSPATGRRGRPRASRTQGTEAQALLDNPVEKRVVEKIVADTTVEESG